MGMMGSVAGSPLAQTKGTDIERAEQETSAQTRRADSEKKAESASGVGETEEDQQSSERDADGRRLLEATPKPEATGEEHEPEEWPRSIDPSGQTGVNLDLTG
jgi:hypothetical protein